MAAVVRGYKMIATLPDKFSKEKEDILTGLNAKVIRTPAELPYFSADSHFGIAKKFVAEDPQHTHLLDQYGNPSNPMSHYDGTAEEIIWQTDGDCTAVVAGVGTGGTMTGLSRKLHEKIPKCQIVGVDPWGSVLSYPVDPVRSKEPFFTEGVG